MTQPVRIQRKRSKGWRMTLDTIYVGRPTQWGNPFFVGRQGTADECVRKYERWLVTEMPILLSEVQILRGKNLACFCKSDDPCHADILLRLANQ